ncbi:hypothetical protein RJ640_028630 [Escallonia rubra]|uniref:Rhodanese domain-containing protein n=1 Tax=Escallonia rubra TaxID=112253 RepID=A0AA88S0A2_9ASTE|nr:hypothetical protein RJ640_028630 [Escallonia rubra]
MATLIVRSVSLALHQFSRPLNFNNRHASVSLLSRTNSTYQLSSPRNTGTRDPSLSFRSMASAGGDAKSTAVPASVPVRVAHELLQAGHRYLDVRTPEEFTAGHAVGAINIPYMFRVGSGMKKNPNFLEEVSSHLGKDDEVIVGCQAGKRSLMAATDLLSAGFTGITDIAGGYAAWTQNGLPTEK